MIYKVWVCLETEYDDTEADSEEEAFLIASEAAMSGGSWDCRVEKVIISAGTWRKHADLETIVYPCDPKKNARCGKTGCYINGGECSHTKDPRYRRED